MNNKLKDYIDALFASAPKTMQTQELKEEMLQNLTDKYNDLIAEGKSEEQAYRIAISSIGDVSALIEGIDADKGQASQPEANRAKKPVRTRNGLITAIAVMLYVLWIIPVILVAGTVGILLMFDLIAIATGLLIWDSAKRSRKENLPVAAAVALYIVCVTPCIAIQNILGVLLMFVVIAVATGLLVYNGSKKKAHVSGDDSLFEDDDSTAKTTDWAGKIGLIFAVALMVAMLIVGGVRSDYKYIHFTDEIILDEFGDFDDFDDIIEDSFEQGNMQSGQATIPNAEQEGAAVPNAAAVPGTAAAESVAPAPGRADGVSVPMAGVQEIEVGWLSGKVQLVAGTGSDITFDETCRQPLSDNMRMQYRLKEGKLSISYCEGNRVSWGLLNTPSKDLTLTIPASMMGTFEELEINSISASVTGAGVYARETQFTTVSGDINVSGIMGTSLDIETTSGRVRAENCTVNELDIETVSGDAEFIGQARDVELGGVSGGFRLTLDSAPNELKTETVSGDVTILMPQVAGNFTAQMDTGSGELSCDFPLVFQNGRYIAGAGASQFRFNSVSGDVRLQANG